MVSSRAKRPRLSMTSFVCVTFRAHLETLQATISPNGQFGHLLSSHAQICFTQGPRPVIGVRLCIWLPTSGNIIAVCPNPLSPGTFLSRTSLLEGHERKFDLSHLRAFGTKCFFLLTIAKKGGKKEAVGPKARIGASVGIMDNMPAYRVLDTAFAVIRAIPFSQVVTHEGHFPLRNMDKWSAEEKPLPESFIPSLAAMNDQAELLRYGLTDQEKEELQSDFSLTRDPYLAGNSSPDLTDALPLDIGAIDIEEMSPPPTQTDLVEEVKGVYSLTVYPPWSLMIHHLETLRPPRGHSSGLKMLLNHQSNQYAVVQC